MKTLKYLVSVISLFFSGPLLGQQITSVIPSSGQTGQEMDIVIRGMGTNFTNQSQVSFGPGITIIGGFKANNSETGLVHIKIESNAAAGPHDVSITSGMEEVTRPAAFNVFQSGNQFSAILDIVPVQRLKVSDFDPNNAANAPLLFSVKLFNDMTERDVRAVITITGDKYGEIGKATKNVKKLQPGAIAAFDNRQFDDYKLSSSGSDVVQLSFQQGSLPADIYTYRLDVYTSNGTLLTSAEAQNVIMNPLTRPELISPGSSFSSPPAAIVEKQPLFQWFSQGSSFDFYLYRVTPGQTSPEEVTLSRPVFKQDGVRQTSLLYPASAYTLREDEVYAWRIVANYDAANTKETLPSEVFWFRLKPMGHTDNAVAELKVSPEDVNIPVNGSMQFNVKAYNSNSEELAIKPSWKVIPSDGGMIDASGNFTAGKAAKAVAIVAVYNDVQDYVTVKIVEAPAENPMMDGFLKKLFGITQ